MLRSLACLLPVLIVVGCGDDGGPGGAGGGGGDDGEGGSGASGGGAALFHCELGELDAPLCEGAQCPFENVGQLDCVNLDNFFVQVSSAADGAPVMLVDPAAFGHSLFLADTSAGVVTELEVPYHAVLATDETGLAYFSYVPPDTPVPWFYEPMGADAEVVADEGVAYWVPRGLTVRDGAAHALALRSSNAGPETLVVATRTGPGQWETEQIGDASSPIATLQLTGDGTPIITYSEPMEMLVRVGDAPAEPVELAPETTATGSFTVVPDETSWRAAVYQDQTRIVVTRPIEGPATADDYAAGDLVTCNPSMDGNCGGTCSETGTSVSSALNAFPIADGLGLMFTELTLDRDGHFEEGECTEAGCPCSYVVDSDRSSSDLVLVRFDDATSEFSEIGRFGLGQSLDYVQVDTDVRDGVVAFALWRTGHVIYGEISATAL